MSHVKLSHPTKTITGNIHLPASKSISNRALIIQHILKQPIQLTNLSTADDTVIMQAALRQHHGKIQLKNAGTCMRFLTAYFAATEKSDVELCCDERMEQRPIKELVDALKKLGAQIEYINKDGFPPLKIRGTKLSGGSINISASASSQFVSALMMIAPLCKEILSIELSGEVTSQPYIEMTAQLMEQFGFDINLKSEIRNSKSEISNPNSQIPILKSNISNPNSQISNYIIESDWSAASYYYELFALSKNGKIFLPNLSLKSLQGDKIIAEYMNLFGVETTEVADGIVIQKKAITPQSIQTLNLVDSPDLAPTLAVVAAATNTPIILTGLQNLVIKESNRLLALQTELRKLGFDITTTNDSLTVHNKESAVGSPQSAEPPTSNIQHPTSGIQTYNDHRMAMAFAPLALLFNEITIEHPEVVEKSYPHFWEDLKTIGFELSFS